MDKSGLDATEQQLRSGTTVTNQERYHLLVDQLTQIQALSMKVGEHPDKQFLLERIVQAAIELLGGEGGCLYLAYPQQEELEIYIEISPLADRYRGARLAYGEGAAGWVAKERKPLLVEDYAAWPFHSDKFGPPYLYRSVISAPLFWDDRLEGVLQVFNTQSSRPFTEDDLKLLCVFANQASIVIQSATLLENEHHQKVLAEKLASAARALSSTLDLTSLLETILEQLADAIPYDGAAILLKDSGEFKLGTQRGLALEDNPATLPSIVSHLFPKIIAQKEAVVLSDVQRDSSKPTSSPQARGETWMGVPLIARGEVVGLVILQSFSPNAFQKLHLDWATTYAQHAALAIENARLFQEKEQQANTLEALRQTSLILTSNLDLDQVLQTILDTLRNFFADFRSAYIFTYSPENGQELRFGAALHRDGQRTPIYKPRPNGLTIQVARSGQLTVINDMENHPLFQDWKGAIVGIPLKISERVVGVMNVSFPAPRQFTSMELSLLGFLGDQAAIAIENASLYQRVESEKRNLSVIYAIGHQLTASLEPDEILQRAIQLATLSLEGHFGLAFRYLPEKDTLSLRAVHGHFLTSIEEYNHKIQWSGERGFIGWVMKNREADLIADVSQDARWWHLSDYDEEVHSAIAAPILFENQLYGILAIMHTETNAFDDADLNLMKAICQELGLALSNAERYQEAQHRLRQVTLLQKLTQNFSRHLDLRELLQTVVDELAANFHYPIIEIFLRNGDHLDLRAYYGNSVIILRIPIHRGVIGRAVRSGQAQVILDVSQDPDYLPDNPQTVSEFAMPILLHGEVVGVLNIETDQNSALSQSDVDFFQLLADQIAIALENATLYENVRRYADQLEEAVTRRTAELSELYELSQEIGYVLTYQDLVQVLLTHLRTAVKCDLAIGCLISSSTPNLYVNAQRPLTEDALSALQEHCQSELRQVLGKDHSIASVEVNLAEHFHSAAPIQSFQSLHHYPIVLNEQIVGMLGIVDEKERSFSHEQLRLLQTFANQASIALQRLENVRQAEKKQISNLVENLSIGILLLDSDHRILVMNPIAEQLLHLLRAETKEGRLISLGLKTIDELLTHPTKSLPLELIIQEPSRRIFEAQASPIGHPPNQWVITLREVTTEREIQMRVQMQERLATVGQLAAGIAHDFNNIMAAILVYADLLRNDPSLSPAAQDRLAIIQQQVQRAASLIRQILDFSRRSVMEQTPLDLLPFMKEFEKMLVRVLPETIRVEFQPQLQTTYSVLADPTRLQQMLMNLVLNARDAMPQGGVLRLSLARLSLSNHEEMPSRFVQPGEWIVIEVHDTGHGIAPEHLPHIFEPFFTTKPVGLGTGLGLAQVYGIVKQHGGYIDVQSQPSLGTTFTVYLPALGQPSQSTVQENPTLSLDGQGKTALVVEDDPSTRNALKALLEAQQYQTLTAADGREALELWETHQEKIELLVSDIVMPRMGGIELYQTLREKQADLKMLLITGHPLNEEYRAALEGGKIHWLQKPFSLTEFSQAIRSLIEQGG
ncbi:MAG: GAF domain-containing protein [Anaerolineales bacterium]